MNSFVYGTPSASEVQFLINCCIGAPPKAMSVACFFLFLTAAYYLMTSKVTAKASVLFTTTCAFGMLVGLLQSIGIIGMMTVDWPINLNGFLSYFQILLLDLDSFGFACFAGAKTEIRYVASVLFFPAAIAWLASNHAVSQLVPRRRWDWTKTASCIGQVLQASLQEAQLSFHTAG